MYTFGRTNVTHSDACRRRIQELMKGDDVGRARLDASRKRKASSQTFERDAPPMPRVGQESGPDDQLPVQEESTRHERGVMEQRFQLRKVVEIRISLGWTCLKEQQARVAKARRGQQVKLDFLKMRMSLSHRVPSEYAWKVQSLEWSQTPGDRKLLKGLPESDVQVTDANTSSFEDPSRGLSSTASVCWKGGKHIRRDQVVDAFRSDCVDIDEKEALQISALLLEIGTVTRDCENHQGIVASQCEKLGLRPGLST